MKIIFRLSIASAGMGFVSLLALSAMTVVPSKSAHTFHLGMMLLALTTALAWLATALWAHRQARLQSQTLSVFARRSLTVAAIAYILLCLTVFIG